MPAFEPVKNADVYFDLHRKVWSCKGRKTGIVEHKARVVVAVFGATMVVRESGRQRVLKEKRKNVHAFARIDHGLACEDLKGWQAFVETQENLIQVSYNPYMAGHFYRKDTMAPVHGVQSLVMLAPEGAPPQVWAVL